MDEFERIKQENEKLLEENKKLKKRQKYGLVWEDKPEEIAEELKRSIPVLKNVMGRNIINGKGYPNHVLIEGDNLVALQGLQFTHRNKIDVIYIDPPYNTGNEDFTYNDKFVSIEDSYKHSKWLSFMFSRLTLSKKLLRKDGVIFLSIDDNEQAPLTLLMNEIFGEDNFIATLVRATNSTKNQTRFVSVSHEYCLLYAKDKSALESQLLSEGTKWEVPKNNVEAYLKIVDNLVKKDLPAEEIANELKTLTSYPRYADFVNYWYVDSRGVYSKSDLSGGFIKNGNMVPIINPLTGKEDPIPPGGFAASSESMQILIDEDRIHFHLDGSLPRRKRYLIEHPTQRPKSIMSDDQRPDVNLLAGMGIEFSNPKQMDFMKRILSIFKKDVTVLDFFAGSATTGHAVIELNAQDNGIRKVILVTNNENNICEEITYQRLKKTINGYTTLKSKKVEGLLENNLYYYKAELENKIVEEQEKNPAELTFELRDKLDELIKIKENVFAELPAKFEDVRFYHNDKNIVCVCASFDFITQLDVIDELKNSNYNRKTLYLFTLDSERNPDIDDLAVKNDIELHMLPQEALRSLTYRGE